MSYMQFQQKCSDCGEEWNAAFGIVGMTQIAAPPTECPKCHSTKLTKIADGWKWTAAPAAQARRGRCYAHPGLHISEPSCRDWIYQPEAPQAATVTQCPKFAWCVMGYDHKGTCSSFHYELTRGAAPAETARQVKECLQCGCSLTPDGKCGSQPWHNVGEYVDFQSGLVASSDDIKAAQKVLENAYGKRETAGEMTAEQFAQTEIGKGILTGARSMLHPDITLDPLADWQRPVAYHFAEAFAKRERLAERAEWKKFLDAAHAARDAFESDVDALESKVADLERERDTARETSKELNRRNGALQHTLNTLTDRNVWYGYYKAAMSLFGWEEEKRKAAESELREMREAVEEWRTAVVNAWDSEHFAVMAAILANGPVLARKAGP